jgi:large subunit ribosomal protein L13
MSGTIFPQTQKINRRWHVIDGKDQVLGRLASHAARLLRGKGNPTFTPYIDGGDFVVIVNAAQVKLTGNKLTQKTAFSHSIYPGGLKLVPYTRLMKEQPEKAVRRAISGMLSKTKLRDKMLARLKVYREGSHRHSAQNPQPYTLS